jgi:hypothetical protein
MPDLLTMSRRYISSLLSAEKTLMNNRNKHELLIINLATVPADRNSNSMPA